jgi:hypothetical protein
MKQFKSIIDIEKDNQKALENSSKEITGEDYFIWFFKCIIIGVPSFICIHSIITGTFLAFLGFLAFCVGFILFILFIAWALS